MPGRPVVLTLTANACSVSVSLDSYSSWTYVIQVHVIHYLNCRPASSIRCALDVWSLDKAICFLVSCSKHPSTFVNIDTLPNPAQHRPLARMPRAKLNPTGKRSPTTAHRAPDLARTAVSHTRASENPRLIGPVRRRGNVPTAGPDAAALPPAAEGRAKRRSVGRGVCSRPLPGAMIYLEKGESDTKGARPGRSPC